MDRDFEYYRKRLQELEEKMDKADEHNRNLLAISKLFAERNVQFQKERDEARAELESKEDQINGLIEGYGLEVEGLENELRDVKADRKEKAKDNENLKGLLEDSYESIRFLSAREKQLMEEVERLNRQVYFDYLLNSDLREHGLEVDGVVYTSEDVKKLQDSFDQADNEIGELRTELDSLKDRYDTLTVEANYYKDLADEKNAVPKAEFELMREDRDLMMEENEELQREVGVLRGLSEARLNQVRQLEARIKEMKANSDNLNQQLSQSHSDYMAFYNACHELVMKLEMKLEDAGIDNEDVICQTEKEFARKLEEAEERLSRRKNQNRK